MMISILRLEQGLAEHASLYFVAPLHYWMALTS